MFKLLAAVITVVLFSQLVRGGETPQLGRPINEAPVPPTILTDGTGLPEGSGNALTGEGLFQTHCSACHGPDGQNGINDQLVGGHGTLANPRPVKTVGSYWPFATTVYDYINRAMPYQAPGSLSSDTVYAVTAYILFKNGIIPADKELNAITLPQVTMPNRNNFVWDFVDHQQ